MLFPAQRPRLFAYFTDLYATWEKKHEYVCVCENVCAKAKRGRISAREKKRWLREGKSCVGIINTVRCVFVWSHVETNFTISHHQINWTIKYLWILLQHPVFSTLRKVQSSLNNKQPKDLLPGKTLQPEEGIWWKKDREMQRRRTWKYLA